MAVNYGKSATVKFNDSLNYINECLKTESPITPELLGRSRQSTRLLHAAMGISTEAGELVDALKKHIFYGKTLDRTNLIEELGDLFWYMALACNELGTTFEQVQEINTEKLRKRYEQKQKQLQAEGWMPIETVKEAEDALLSSQLPCTGDSWNKTGNLPNRPTKPPKTGLLPVKDGTAQVEIKSDEIGLLPITPGLVYEPVKDWKDVADSFKLPTMFTEAAAINRDLDAERAILEDRQPQPPIQELPPQPVPHNQRVINIGSPPPQYRDYNDAIPPQKPINQPNVDTHKLKPQPSTDPLPPQKELRCPACGYTDRDRHIHGDHRNCANYGFFPGENTDIPRKL